MAVLGLPVLPAAGIGRRWLSIAYESLLAFAVVFLASLLFYGAADGQFSGLVRHLYQSYVLIVLGLYFVWCWRHGGQTLPMKTWGLRLVSADDGPVSLRQCTIRYALACASVLFAGAGYFWAWFDRDRQFLHDRLAGTRIVICDL